MTRAERRRDTRTGSKDIKEQRKKLWRIRRWVSKVLPGQRVAGCQKKVIPTRNQKDETVVHICKHKETESAFFANLQQCGSVWACIFCAMKITEQRKLDMIKVREKCRELGLIPYMKTLTFRHNKREKLADLLRSFLRALDYYYFNRPFWRNYKKTIGLKHFVKVLEVTWSEENGWHVHLHMLLICEPFDKTTGEFFHEPVALDFLEPWQSACSDAGLGVPDFHGVTITSHDAVNTYISKWGLESELTKQHTKKGREGHYTPFDLARIGEETANPLFGRLFSEYYYCFKGRRQMVRSKGFNEFFGLGKYKTDQELADESIEPSERIGVIHKDEWNLIKFHEAQEEILEAVELSGMVGFWDVIEVLRECPCPFKQGMTKNRGS